MYDEPGMLLALAGKTSKNLIATAGFTGQANPHKILYDFDEDGYVTKIYDGSKDRLWIEVEYLASRTPFQ
ncbi:hypothetical protein [Proteiniphilum sp. UBA5384]|uniref:hypothetical protein n=1 Tax=Proteiniphilum sp. UBA5384 TaxID=1947279 RepID=UPI0025FED68A|nr:hypothetical protein [Proteiniphilum sp. UBA5384]